MYNQGDKVCCIDDNFESIVYELYQQLPNEGTVYTVRELKLGRGNVIPGQNHQDTYLVLLEEIHNPLDPLCRKEPQELGFSSHRFVPLTEYQEKVAAKKEKELDL